MSNFIDKSSWLQRFPLFQSHFLPLSVYICVHFQTSGPTPLPAMASLLSLYWMVTEHSMEFSWVQQFSLSFLCLFLSHCWDLRNSGLSCRHANPKSLNCWAQSQISLFWQRSDNVSKFREFFLLLSCLNFFFKFIYSIYFCLCWVFTALCWLSVVAGSRGDSLLWFAGLSLPWLLLLWSTRSRAWGLSSCSS